MSEQHLEPIYVHGMMTPKKADEMKKGVLAAVETPDRIRQRFSAYHQIDQINSLLQLLEASLPPIVTPEAARALGMIPGQVIAPMVALTTQELAAIRIALDSRAKLLDKKLPGYKPSDYSDFVDPNAQTEEEVAAMSKAEMETRLQHLLNTVQHLPDNLQLTAPIVPDYLK